MKNKFLTQNILLLAALLLATSCKKDFLELKPKGTELETNFYQTQDQIFQGLVATYDVLGWEGTDGWNMVLGLFNAASDDCYAGGSDASDQPNWVAWDNFTLNPLLGPQMGLWRKYYSGVYRANLILQKIEAVENLDPAFKARTIAELKFLRGYFYFDLARLFGNVPVFTKPISLDEIAGVKQASPAAVFTQIEKDLTEAKNTPELPETVPPAELGRVTHGAVAALLGKVILFQNDNGRMLEAAANFEEVINGGNYFLTPNYGDIFKQENEFGPESVFEIQYASNRPGDYNCCFNSGPVNNATEGNYNIQFFGMRDYSGPIYSPGWSFCPVTPELVTFMQGDPRFQHTIIDGKALKQGGASYTIGYQNTDYFIKKYAPIAENQATDGETALAWGQNIRAIRYADVLLMAAEAIVRGGGSEATAREYLNQVRARVALQPESSTGQALLAAIYKERRLELATEGQRFWDLVRTGGASALPGFTAGTHEHLPIPQQEIELSQGALQQNPGY